MNFTFDEAMSVRCTTCQRRAGWHRMTNTGKMYCLKLNKAGVKLRNTMVRNGHNYDPATMHHIPVKYLERAPFDEGVTDTIARGLTDYMEKP